MSKLAGRAHACQGLGNAEHDVAINLLAPRWLQLT